MDAIPIPDRPRYVSLTWTATKSALVVECERCRESVAIYAVLLTKNPDLLADAVDEHWGCRT